LSRAGWGRLLQALASVAVLYALSRQVDAAQMALLADRIAPLPLLAALGVKILSLGLHELRLWVALPAPRPRLSVVVAIGFACGLLNLVLPGRAGDLAVVVALGRRCGQPAATATAAVGVVAFLEAAPFGLLLLGLLVFHAPLWQALLGEDAHLRAIEGVSLLTGGGLVAAVVAVALGRRLAAAPAPQGASRPINLLRDTLLRATDSLSGAGDVGRNLGLGVLQVLLMVEAFALGLAGAGLEVERPWLAAAGVLALSSLASVALPPTFAAGPAAASVAILGLFGLPPEAALAYGAAYWLISQVPAVLMGVPASLWLQRSGGGAGAECDSLDNRGPPP
jgi:hypothetical protein